jgi:ERCC4-type nuclease
MTITIQEALSMTTEQIANIPFNDARTLLNEIDDYQKSIINTIREITHDKSIDKMKKRRILRKITTQYTDLHNLENRIRYREFS